MFELSFVKKYLAPKRKQLSVSLISLMSVFVIALVVWLLLLFLSITEGIERNWVGKLTSLNAPLKIHPTEKYYNSYYYLVDQFSQASGYVAKSIGQKALAALSDPYNKDLDVSLPSQMPAPDLDLHNRFVDPVKRVYGVLAHLKKEHPDFSFQDFEMSGAMMRLNLIRLQGSTLASETETHLTQVSFLTSFAEQNPTLSKLLMPPSAEDLNHLLYLANRGTLPLNSLLPHLELEKVRTTAPFWRLPSKLLVEKQSYPAKAYFEKGQITHLILPTQPEKDLGTLCREGDLLIFNGTKLPPKLSLIVEGPLELEASLLTTQAKTVPEIRLQVKGKLQGQPLSGEIPWMGLTIAKAKVRQLFETTPSITPPWPYQIQGSKISLPRSSEKQGILLAKQMRESGVRMGDSGFLSYPASTGSSLQEQHIPIFVAGFYDPGIMAVGGKCILAPAPIVASINAAQTSFSLERTSATGIQVWFEDIAKTETIKKEIQLQLDQLGISPYWKIESYRNYDFAKDLMQQFESDKTLFTLIGVIILTVACCNVISLLLLLVSDKKKEIGVLQALGAPKRSIAIIFGLCGASIGFFSALIGTFMAIITLQNIDSVVKLLSLLQGHQAFNALFFGNSLPKELSLEAMTFVLIATPLLSLIAGLVPAIKACKLSPSETLRSP